MASVAGPADRDWFSISSDAPGWGPYFTGGPLRVGILATRLSPGCTDESLRLTLYVNGEYRSSHVVYPGVEAAILSVDTDRGSRYELRLDTNPSTACIEPLDYALRALPYPPVPDVTYASSPKYSHIRCEAYTGVVRQLTRDIARKKGKKRATLVKQRTAATRKKKKACARR